MSESPLRPRPAGEDTPSPGEALVFDLARRFSEQVRRALNFDLDGTPTSLAIVDHYLSTARNESRAAILSLLAAGAGAYFGELLRDHFGAFWIGDGNDPRRLRLLLAPQFVYLAPVDMAYQAVLGEPLAPDDPRQPTGVPLDSGFHLRQQSTGEEESDHAFIHAQLEQLPPLPEDQFYSLTGRFETLELIVSRLAHRLHMQDYPPRLLTLDDYLQTLADPSTAAS